MESLIETLTCLNTNLAGKANGALSERMHYYDNHMLRFKHDFYTVTIDSDPQIIDLVKSILKHLNIPAHQWDRYLGAPLTVYDFLIELHEHNGKKHHKINEMIELIDEQVSVRVKKVVYGGLILLAIAEGSLPFLSSLGGFTVLHGLIAAALFAPVVGTIYTLAVAGYSIYKNFQNTKASFLQRMQNSFFLLAHAALKFAGYGILIAAATTSSPVVAILFTAAATIAVLREVASLVRMVIQDKRKEPIHANASLSVRQHHARHDLEYIKRRNELLINIATAVISVGIVALWSFVPGGIFVVVGAIAAIGVLFIAEQLAHKYNKRVMKKRLQAEFEALELEDQQKQALRPAVEPTDDIVNDNVERLSSDSEITAIDEQPTLRSPDTLLSRPSRNGIFSAGERRISFENSQLNTPHDLDADPSAEFSL